MPTFNKKQPVCVICGRERFSPDWVYVPVEGQLVVTCSTGPCKEQARKGRIQPKLM